MALNLKRTATRSISAHVSIESICASLPKPNGLYIPPDARYVMELNLYTPTVPGAFTYGAKDCSNDLRLISMGRQARLYDPKDYAYI